eukprot:1324689-Amorphochlora_amoeboformis.AAC.1
MSIITTNTLSPSRKKRNRNGKLYTIPVSINLELENLISVDLGDPNPSHLVFLLSGCTAESADGFDEGVGTRVVLFNDFLNFFWQCCIWLALRGV